MVLYTLLLKAYEDPVVKFSVSHERHSSPLKHHCEDEKTILFVVYILDFVLDFTQLPARGGSPKAKDGRLPNASSFAPQEVL